MSDQLTGLNNRLLTDLEKLKIFKNNWRKYKKECVMKNIDQQIVICGKIAREISEITEDLKEAKQKCVAFEDYLQMLKQETFGEKSPEKKDADPKMPDIHIKRECLSPSEISNASTPRRTGSALKPKKMRYIDTEECIDIDEIHN